MLSLYEKLLNRSLRLEVQRADQASAALEEIRVAVEERGDLAPARSAEACISPEAGGDGADIVKTVVIALDDAATAAALVQSLQAENAALQAANAELQGDIRQLRVIVGGLQLQSELDRKALVAAHRTLVAATDTRDVDLYEARATNLELVQRVVSPVAIPPVPPVRRGGQ